MTVVYIRDRHVRQRLREEIAGLAEELQIALPPIDRTTSFGELLHICAGLHQRRETSA